MDRSPLTWIKLKLIKNVLICDVTLITSSLQLSSQKYIHQCIIPLFTSNEVLISPPHPPQVVFNYWRCIATI